MIRIFIKFIVIILFISGCGTVPRDTSNACLIFSENYFWYKAVKGSEKKWGAPIELQMAIIQRESDFDWLAVPEWDKLFKIIPYKRKSSSLGYSQAVNATWEQFQRETDQKYALRISFYDSVDFIGWYINKTNEILKISKNDYFKQYVAYYEGWGNYKNYKKSKVAIPYAKEVEKMAIKYREQMSQCKSQLTTSKFIIF
ncbi:MAG: lytic transglycosylase [Pelagibacterales bacterium]|jgi:hypothetical protein|nr:lytic transglycosylase [Pelagibacterales bacterium]